MAPLAVVPAGTGACWQLAPDELGRQVQPPWPLLFPWTPFPWSLFQPVRASFRLADRTGYAQGGRHVHAAPNLGRLVRRLTSTPTPIRWAGTRQSLCDCA